MKKQIGLENRLSIVVSQLDNACKVMTDVSERNKLIDAKGVIEKAILNLRSSKKFYEKNPGWKPKDVKL